MNLRLTFRTKMEEEIQLVNPRSLGYSLIANDGCLISLINYSREVSVTSLMEDGQLMLRWLAIYDVFIYSSSFRNKNYLLISLRNIDFYVYSVFCSRLLHYVNFYYYLLMSCYSATGFHCKNRLQFCFLSNDLQCF